MKYLVSLFLLTFYLKSFADRDVFYLVNDPDGWVNVRDFDNKEIIDKLYNNTLVYVYEPNDDDVWLGVEYVKGDSTSLGNVHKSRLIPLSDFEKIRIIRKTKSHYTFGNDRFTINIVVEPFKSEGRTFQYEQMDEYGYKLIKTIDNKYVWGVDGNTPKNQYKNICINFSTGKVLILPPEALSDLFDANLDSTELFYNRKTDTLYITCLNGDGAGSYLVAWTIKDGEYKERLLTHGF